MKIHAINEQTNAQCSETSEWPKNNLPTFRKQYMNLISQIETKNTEQTATELKNILNSIETELWKCKQPTNDGKMLNRLKLGCLKQLARLCQDSEKCDYFSKALALEPTDTSLLVDYAIALYNTDNIYMSMGAFKKVVTLNLYHAIAYKYLVLFDCILCNFGNSLNSIEHLLNVAKNRTLATKLLYCIEKICSFASIKQLVDDTKRRYRIEYSVISTDDRDALWFLGEYKKSRHKQLPCLIERKVFKISEVFHPLDFLSFIQLMETTNELIFSKLGCKIGPLNINRRIGPSCKKAKSQLVPETFPPVKRSERGFSYNSTDNLFYSLSVIASKLQISSSAQKTNDFSGEETESDTLQKPEIQLHDDFMKIVIEKVKNASRLDQFLVVLVRTMAIDTPLDQWTFDMCRFYAHVFVNIQGKFFTHLDVFDSSHLMPFLRYIEIYKLLLNETDFVDNESKASYAYTLCVSISRIKEYFLENSDKRLSQITASRIFCSLALASNEPALSTAYFNACLNSLNDLSIPLFAAGCVTYMGSISKALVLKLITRCSCGAVVDNSFKLYKQRLFEKTFQEYRQNFKNNRSNISSLKTDMLLKYLKLLLKSYLSLPDFFPEVVDDVLDILNHLLGFKHSNLFKDFLSPKTSLLTQCFEKFISDFSYLEKSSIDRLFELLVESIQVDNICEVSDLCIRLWDCLSLIVFHRARSGDGESMVAVYVEFAELLHQYFVKQRLCCLGTLRPLLRRALVNLIEASTLGDPDSSLSITLNNLIDALFFCLVGYPSHKRVASSLDYLKDHMPTTEKHACSKTLQDFSLAFRHYKPLFECSYMLITESLKSVPKKYSMNIDLFKFLSSLGNSIAEIVQNRNGLSLLMISQNCENCLLGLKPWPSFIKQNTSLTEKWSHSFDFSIFQILSDYCTRTSSYASALRWTLLFVTSQPSSYLSWWACSTYLYLKFEEELTLLKYDNNELPIHFTQLIRSLRFCYSQTLTLLPSGCNHFSSVLNDFSWIFYNLSLFLEAGYVFPPTLQHFALNFVPLSLRGFDYLIQNSSMFPEFNAWTCALQMNNSVEPFKKNQSDAIKLTLFSVSLIDQESILQEKNSTLGMTLLLFELCLILWNCSEPDITELSEAVKKCLFVIERCVPTRQTSSIVTSLSETINNTLMDAGSGCSQSNIESCAQEENSQCSQPGFNFPKDEAIFLGKPHRSLALLGMCRCLYMFPTYSKFVCLIAECLFELVKQQGEYMSSFNKLLVDFMIGKTSTLLTCPSAVISKIFSPLHKRPSSTSYAGIFNMNSRTNLFRRTWKMNSRLLDGTCVFQHYVYRSLKVLIQALARQSDASGLVHICSNLARERTNTFILEPHRTELIDDCRKEVIPILESFAEKIHFPTLSTVELDGYIDCCNKLKKLPKKIVKDFKEPLSKMVSEASSVRNRVQVQQTPSLSTELVLPHTEGFETNFI